MSFDATGETLRPAGQHSRRGVAPVCSLERVRPLERDTGPSEGLRLRFGKEKTLAARDNSVGILGAGGHRGRIPPSAGPEGSHERVPSAQICCELRTGRLLRESNGRASFPRPFLLRPRPFGNNPCRPRPPGSLGASPRAPPCRETCTAPSRMFTSHARRSSLRRKKNLCTLISALPLPFCKGIFPEGQEGGYYCCRKCEEEIRRLRREAQNKPVLRSQGHSQLQPLGHVRTQNST